MTATGSGAGLESAFFPSEESLTGLAPASLDLGAFGLSAFSGLTPFGGDPPESFAGAPFQLGSALRPPAPFFHLRL